MGGGSAAGGGSVRRAARWCCLALLALCLLAPGRASAGELARAIPSIGVSLGLALPFWDSYLELTPGMAVAVKFQVGDRKGWPLAPYLFINSSKHHLETLKPYEDVINTAADDFPRLRDELLNGDVRVTTYGVGVGYLIVDDSWIQPYVDVGVGGGAISFSGEAADDKGYGGGSVSLHGALGVDFFFWRGFALGLDLRTYHLWSENPFKRSASDGKGFSMTCVTASLKYWDR